MKHILVVVDMQQDFICGSLGTAEAQAIIPKVIEKIEGFDGTIYFTKDTHGEDYLQTAEGKKLPVEHCIAGTPGWEIPESLLRAARDKDYEVIEKPTFGSEKLAETLKGIHETDSDMTIQFVGLCTDICVVSNAIVAKMYLPDIQISVDANCCAGTSPEAHDAALLTMKMCQIDLVE